jgi:two-component system NtrC family sensor kinase
MKGRILFPLRYKILLVLLLVVSSVVGAITYTMANLFYDDKRAYIHDLTSIVVVHTAQEMRALLIGYRERLQIFARLAYDNELPQEKKKAVIKDLFGDFKGFVAITLHDADGDVVIYDVNQFKTADVTQEEIDRYRKKNPLPLETLAANSTLIENSTFDKALPTFTIAIQHKMKGEAGKLVAISALIRLDELLNVTERSQLFETFVVDGKGALFVHPDLERAINREHADWVPQLDSIISGRNMGTTKEYVAGGEEWVGGFASVGFGSLTVGVQIQKSAVLLTAKALINNLLMTALALLLVSALLGLLGSYRITQPMRRLSAAAHKLGQGDFNVTLKSNSWDEMGLLSNSFNDMADELKSREEKLLEANQQLVQSEKMSAFGQLSAGIAHEVKNPLAGILGYAQLTLRKLDDDDPLVKNITVIEKEAKRCKNIIENLMGFARQEHVEHAPCEINQIVSDAVTIVDHQLTINRITIKNLSADGLPKVMANSNQIQQVLMNLMINAQQAMEVNGEGLLLIRTRLRKDRFVSIVIADNGPGMNEEVQKKLFEPFFTTKPAGKGTGLGLSVSYGIINEHGGKITVQSTEGKGTVFIITLPLASSAVSSSQDLT